MIWQESKLTVFRLVWGTKTTSEAWEHNIEVGAAIRW